LGVTVADVHRPRELLTLQSNKFIAESKTSRPIDRENYSVEYLGRQTAARNVARPIVSQEKIPNDIVIETVVVYAKNIEISS
jgi:hypothetical protein